MKWIDDLNHIIQRSVDYGWHERNAGNISIRLKREELPSDLNKEVEWVSLETNLENLKEEYIFITGTGIHLRNVLRNLETSSCILEINASGDAYRILWGHAKPSSELPTHLMCHNLKKTIDHRVIMHSHPDNVIALTFALPLDSEIFSRKLWEMNTECPVVFPEGVGVLKWMVPGTHEIGYATRDLMHHYNAVIWAHHGLFCSGKTLDDTFGLMETIEKSARILVKVLSMGTQCNKIETSQLQETAKRFNVSLTDDFESSL